MIISFQNSQVWSELNTGLLAGKLISLIDPAGFQELQDAVSELRIGSGLRRCFATAR
jgi:hypothetical protein